MYPYFRASKYFIKAKFGKQISLKDRSVLNMRVFLSDIDIYPELNNGRYLTLMDLGRYDFGVKVGLFSVLKEKKWGLMVAGNFTRYRYRLKLFQKFRLVTELVGYDDKWFYFYQQTERKKKVHSAALIRTAVTSKSGLVKTIDVAKAMQIEYSPHIPKWVDSWIELNEQSPTIG